MPRIKKLLLENFRNFHSTSLIPSQLTNILYGENGAGKTSLLEAISVLAHGKSFRSHKYRQLIKDGQRSFTLFAEVEENGRKSQLGVSRNVGGESTIRIDGRAASSSAQLAHILPLLVLTTSSFSLLEGPPKLRRQFFDWIVFHVEHDFSSLWKSYMRCLKQRNSMLRHDKIHYATVKPWDQEIGKIAHRIDELRRRVFNDFSELLYPLTGQYNFGSELSLDYVSGWPKGELDYQRVLFDSFVRDCKLGYTQYGCHRSDIKIRLAGSVAVDILSRGQQKLLIAALFLSAAKFFIRTTDRLPLFVIDDFTAELDSANVQLLLEQVLDLGAQVFLTAVDPEAARQFRINPDQEPIMFHVEHGRLLDH